MNKLYFVQKEGVYAHGVFFITDNLDEAKAKAEALSKAEDEDPAKASAGCYFSWVVYEYKEEFDHKSSSHLGDLASQHICYYRQ